MACTRNMPALRLGMPPELGFTKQFAMSAALAISDENGLAKEHGLAWVDIGQTQTWALRDRERRLRSGLQAHATQASMPPNLGFSEQVT